MFGDDKSNGGPAPLRGLAPTLRHDLLNQLSRRADIEDVDPAGVFGRAGCHEAAFHGDKRASLRGPNRVQRGRARIAVQPAGQVDCQAFGCRGVELIDDRV